ncbi:DUF6328 family protein [Cryptosporangium sp. NPDC048952]|uniref:DUF6328 family protein n=1 Tax=Cryptosporangium sp. NPDC048952 TaxID=3363961 RepID=UPI003714480D
MSAELTTGRNERRDPRTQETPTQRWNRNYLEILHETRAAQIGTQLLLVFLLTLAFTSRFDETTRFQRMVYVVSLVLVAGATCLLIAPAPFHRLVFRRRLEAQLVKASSRFAFWGVTLMMLAVNGVLLLILDVVMGTSYALPITGGTLLWFLTWWYFAPGWTRRGQKRRRKEATVVALEVAAEKLRSERGRSEHVRSERVKGGDLARALNAPAPALGSTMMAAQERPGPHPPQLRPGPTWPAPRLPMMPTPQPPRANSDQLGYPGGRLPALGYDRPSPQPGAATGPYPPYRADGYRAANGNGRGAPFGPGPAAPVSGAYGSGPAAPVSGAYGSAAPVSGAYGPAPVSGAYGPSGRGPAGAPAPVSGPVGAGSARFDLGGPIGGIDVPSGPYATIDPLGPVAAGPMPHQPAPYGNAFDGAAAQQPDGSGWTSRAGRHHGISLTDLPAAYTTGEVPILGPEPGMQNGRSGDGMQHGRADDGVTQFGVALPLGPAPTGLPAPGGEAVQTPTGPYSSVLPGRSPAAETPAGAVGPAIAGPAVAGPAPVGPTDTGSYPIVGIDQSEPFENTDGVIGRARVVPPNPAGPKHH